MQETALVFSASRKSHEEKKSAGKKAMSVISKINNNHFLNSLCHKKLIYKVTTTKSFIKPRTLTLTNHSHKKRKLSVSYDYEPTQYQGTIVFKHISDNAVEGGKQPLCNRMVLGSKIK